MNTPTTTTVSLLSGISWWKWLSIVLVLYSIIGGFLVDVPRLAILNESIRNLFFHVTIWFSMIIIMFASMYYAIKYLSNGKAENDIISEQCVNTGIFLGILGLLTGAMWAKFTWGAWWVNDAKLNGAASAMLVYLAYVVLRGSIPDFHKRARISAVYAIFAFALMIVFIMILPRMTDSLHPGSGGNPGFGTYDLDKNMRMVFYPAVIGWALFSAWITNILVRIRKLQLENDQIQ